MIDPVLNAAIHRILEQDLKEKFPRLAKGRREYIIRKITNYCIKLPIMVYGVTIIDGAYNSGPYLQAWHFKYKKNRSMSVMYCVG